MKTSRLVLLSLSVVAAVPGFAATGKTPDLTQLCRKECPNAQNNTDAFACIENYEHGHGGERGLKKADRSCYEAHESYERTRHQHQSAGIESSEIYRHG